MFEEELENVGFRVLLLGKCKRLSSSFGYLEHTTTRNTSRPKFLLDFETLNTKR